MEFWPWSRFTQQIPKNDYQREQSTAKDVAGFGLAACGLSSTEFRGVQAAGGRLQRPDRKLAILTPPPPSPPPPRTSVEVIMHQPGLLVGPHYLRLKLALLDWTLLRRNTRIGCLSSLFLSLPISRHLSIYRSELHTRSVVGYDELTW